VTNNANSQQSVMIRICVALLWVYSVLALCSGTKAIFRLPQDSSVFSKVQSLILLGVAVLILIGMSRRVQWTWKLGLLKEGLSVYFTYTIASRFRPTISDHSAVPFLNMLFSASYILIVFIALLWIVSRSYFSR
jgi:hypothetical protein